MKPVVWMLALVAMLSSCATGRLSDAQKLSLYNAHAGAPVKDFHYFGQINGWTPLGDSAVAVWTKPGEAWLLDISGPCPDIEFTPVILVTSRFDRVTANFDRVIAKSHGSIDIPCLIRQIRPIDTKAIRKAEKMARDQAASPAAPPSGT